MKILVVDRNAVVRAGINLILKEAGEMIDFDNAEAIGDALLMVQAKEFDAVLIGLSLPNFEGFGILEELRRHKPSLPMVVVGMHADEQLAVKAYVMGADGFVEADKAADDLIQAISKVVKGRKFVSDKIMEAVVVELRNITVYNRTLTRLKPLSGREKQIAALLTTGATNKEIAWQLAINVKTVSTYKARVLSKLELKNLAELVKYQMADA